MTSLREGNNPDNVVGAVETNFQIINALYTNGPMRVTELADALDISPGAAHKHLTTLIQHDFAVKSGTEYRLGLRFLDIGGLLRTQVHGSRLIKRTVQEIAIETGERTQFFVLENGRAVVLYREGGDHAVNTRARVGIRHYPNQIAAGKAMLSILADSEIERILDFVGLPESTDQTITDRESFQMELNRVRDQEYAVSKSESHEGLWAVSVPLHHREEHLVGAIAVAGPKQRIRTAIEEGSLIEELRTRTNELELNLKYDW